MNAKRTVARDDSPVSALAVMLAEIECLPVTEGARSQFLQLLRRMQGQRVWFGKRLLVMPGRVRMAQKLLDDGMTVAQARDAMCERHGVGRATAYRLIALALSRRFQDRQLAMFPDNGEKT